MHMIPAWIETANARQYTMGPNDPRGDAAAWLPDPPVRHLSRGEWVQWVVRAMLALTIFGAVFPSDLYLANALLGDPIPALRDPMVINSSVTFSVALAVPVLPLALLAIFLHIRSVARGQREESAG